MKHSTPYSPYCWITTLFLELGVVHQPARERYMYLAKEYSQKVSVRLESRKIIQQFTVIVMVDHISECLLCACAFSQVFVKTKSFLVSSPLVTCSNKLSSNSKLLSLNFLKTAINFMSITFSMCPAAGCNHQCQCLDTHISDLLHWSSTSQCVIGSCSKWHSQIVQGLCNPLLWVIWFEL